MNHTKILQIEDDNGDAEQLSRMLAKSAGNYRVDRASTFSEGLALSREANYRLIVVDLHLPDVDGFEAIDRLASEFPESAIVVISGAEDDSIHLQAIQHGAVDFIYKLDITPSTLHRCFQQNLLRLAQHEQIQELVRCVNEKNVEVERQAAQLREKNKRLERLNEESRNFVNNVSHEFRTPLCVVKQYASLMVDEVVGPVNAEQCKMLRTIEDRVDDLNNMVDDMLDISRFESGMLAAHRTTGNPNDLLLRILPPLTQRAGLRDVEIKCVVDEVLPEVYCDFEKASRTLINLIANAIKFSHKGGKIIVRLSHNMATRSIDIAVEDEGVGIPAKQFKVLFARFRQGSDGVRSSTKGFGLGLNIARELVDLNLGELTVESEVGVGSTFAFSIPEADGWEVASRYLRRLANQGENRQLDVVSIRLPGKPDDCTDAYAADIHAFLNLVLQSNDLLLPTGNRSWLIMLHNGAGLDSFIAQVAQEISIHNRNRPQGPLPGLQVAVRGSYDATFDYDLLRELVQHDQVKPPHFLAWSTIPSTVSDNSNEGQTQ
ncbi:MAG: ATP-binding protein [Aureliella sp.]